MTFFILCLEKGININMKKEKIKVLYDYQVLSFQKYGGISRYFYELYTSYKNVFQNEMDVCLPIFYSINYYFATFIKQHKKSAGRISQLGNKIKTILDICINYLLSSPYDIIHPTYYFPDYLKFIPRFINKDNKLIITVYDMICEIFYPDNKDISRRAELIQKADGIIAISEKTKEDLLRIYPTISEDKVRVIYLGNSMKDPQNKNTIQFPEKYILMVGNRTQYKNGNIVLEAFAKSKENVKDLKLLCVGGGPFDSNEKRMIEELGLENAVIQMSLSDEELFYAYKYAECFVFPSLYEGFGIPILESFFCGCPAILSNASCFPEIAQDAALYFDPQDVDMLMEKIFLLINNPDVSRKLVEKGYERLKFFSWEKTVEETYKFYQEVINC